MSTAVALDKDTQTLVALLDGTIKRDEQEESLFDKKKFARRLDIGEMLEILEATLAGKYHSFIRDKWGEARVTTLSRCLRLWKERYKIMSEAAKRGKDYPNGIGMVEALEWIKEPKPDKEALKKKAKEFEERLQALTGAKEILSTLGDNKEDKDKEERLKRLRANTQQPLSEAELQAHAVLTEMEVEAEELRNEEEDSVLEPSMQWAYQLNGFLDPMDCEPSYLSSGLLAGDIALYAEVDGKKVKLSVTKAVVEK